MVTDNTNQADDTTAFLRAARSGNLEKVVEYLDTDLDINTANLNGLNALHLASKDGHVEIVTELLKRGAHVDAATKKGNTALHIASLAGQAEIVNILLQYGSTVNIQSQNGFTPLYMAAQENHDQVVKILLYNGANQSLATEDGFTPLAVAMQQGHDKVVSVLLENDSKGKVRLPALHIAAKKDDCKAADLLLQNDHKPDVTSKSGFTPLHIAAHYGNEEIARLLIKRGADVNYLAKHNISPLHVAAKWGKNNMVKILLENSATIDSKTRDGLTPLHCAARSGHDQVVAVLLESSAPISARTKNGLAPLHMASQGDHVDAARVLLYHRAPVDEVTIDYLTSLHVAAHCGHVRVAKLLLDRKADPNARALNGFTPLHIACKKNRIKVVELLVKHGASIESTTESGLTPLHVASFMGCMNIVIFLLQHEANPDVPTVRGETPLHLAARANQTDIIRILLRNGAKVDARAREQQTPLHVASRLGNVDIVMLLLQHGAEVDTATKDMYTALHIAAKEGQEEVAAILVENNASLKAATKNGFTPLHIAAKYGNINVAKILLQKDNALDAKGKNEITALHLACHYDHPGVAGLLLERGASPCVTSQNGHTPLHVAARKNQMEIASTLLEHGADANAESKAGFTPVHLSAQKGHHDMTNLLIEHGADPNHTSKNGLTALHLCAQEDFVRVASILVKNGANVESRTETGYRPIHVAAHFGNPSMVRFLLKQNSEIDVKTNQDYTPLHQAAQQGHAHVASALLDGNASHGARTNDGLTALNIAQKLGYISVMEVLKGLPYDNLAPCNKNWEEKYKVVAPESLQEACFMSDSDDEGGSDILVSEQPYRYLTADLMKSLRDDSLPIDVTRDDPIHRQVSKEDRQEFVQSNNYCSAENFEMQDSTTLGRLHPRSFLVSFLVDARGGAMKGCRHSGVRIVVPPRRATMPIRVTCRLIKATKTTNPPPLMEGEALATRIVEMGPVGATFLGPVLIDVPHFASARGNEREIIILRSENGETWKEHDNASDNDDTLASTPHDPQMSASYSGRITRIITTDFPQYFAIITRIKQEVHVIGSEGGILISSVVNHVQAVFPPGALTKKIKVGLQAHVVPHELTAKLLGNCVAVSPVITIEPRRRKFHKPITLTIPVPEAANKGMINQYGGETPTLRLLCSIAGGTSEAQWEDVTGSTPLTFMNDRVSFTTTVSARFWLMDCRNVGEVPKMATELYRESLFVPFVTNFVIYSKRMDLLEATLRILCMTDGKEGPHTLERQEEFLEIVKSRDVEALDGKDLYIEFSGNLTPVTKSGVQLKLTFRAFRQNRLSFHAKVKDPLQDPVARMLFMREPKVAKGEPSQQPICILNIVLPELLAKEKLPGKLDNENDYEDSNIISQKMDSYASEYETEGREKSDYPKVVVPSPSSERKDFAASDSTVREDAAIIHESFAQKVACPLEIVDASYPNKIDAEGRKGGDDDSSPDAVVVVEKQTYSEKLKFWEEIARKKDAANAELSAAANRETKKEEVLEEEVEEEREEEKVEAEVELPDISECSVAEKAHYFEEQIQKESVIPAKTPQISKTPSESDSSKSSEKEKDIEKTSQKQEERAAVAVSLATDNDDFSLENGFPSKTIRKSIGETDATKKLLSLQLIDNQAAKDDLATATTSKTEISGKTIEGSGAGIPEEGITEKEFAQEGLVKRKPELAEETVPSTTNGIATTIGESFSLPLVTDHFSSASVIKICGNLLDEERKGAESSFSSSSSVDVNFESTKRVEEVVEETSADAKDDRGGTTLLDVTEKPVRDVSESETIRDDQKADVVGIREDEVHATEEGLKAEEIVTSAAQQDAAICRAFLDNEIASVETVPAFSEVQTTRINVDAIKKEFESRIPKHVSTAKVETKSARSVKPKSVNASESQIPVLIEEKTPTSIEASSKSSPEVAAEPSAGKKPSESRIPIRTNETPRQAIEEFSSRRYESGSQARAEIIGELKERFEAAMPAMRPEVDSSPSSGAREDSVRMTESKKSHHSVRESCREEISTSGIFVPGAGETFELFSAKLLSGMEEPGSFASVKSTVDHRTSARKEERETVSSEILTAEGKRLSMEVAEKERAEEKKSETKESKLVEETPTQRIEESERDGRESEKKLEMKTRVKLLDEGKTFEAEGSAAKTALDSAESGTFKSRQDEHGFSSDETNVKILDGSVSLASVEIREVSPVEEEVRTASAAAKDERVSPVTPTSDATAEEKLIKESEARVIAETIIRSIESEIESRSILPVFQNAVEKAKERQSSTQVTATEVELAFDEESKRGSISVTEDLTRDEESSPRCSLPFEDSSARIHHDRDMTISPSTASDRTEMEDSMGGDSNESSEARKHQTIDQEKQQTSPVAAVIGGETRDTVFSRKESFDELAGRDAAALQRMSGARVLEIIEPSAAEVEETTKKVEPLAEVLSTEKDDVVSLGDLVVEEIPKSDEIVGQKIDDSDPDGSPLVSPKIKIQSLDIKPVDWMIGDEKIEISESLQPSQVFNQELEEYESVVKRMSSEDAEEDTETVPMSIPRESPRSKFTVIPVSDKQLESELVENNLDISCQELMDTLQREFDAKTPTDNFVLEMSKDDFYGREKVEAKVEPATTTLDETIASDGQQRTKEEVESVPTRLEISLEEKKEIEKIEDKKGDIVETEEATETISEVKTEQKAPIVQSVESVTTDRRHSGKSAATKGEEVSMERHRRTDHAKVHHDAGAGAKAKKETETTSLDLSSRYAITVLDQVVKKEIAEVKESLEAAKQDLIEELSENSETVFQIKDSPSEFQFKLQPEAIPNELPFLYIREQPESGSTKKEDAEAVVDSSSPVAKPRSTCEESKTETEAEVEKPKGESVAVVRDESESQVPSAVEETDSSDKGAVMVIARSEIPISDARDLVSASSSPVPVPASRSSSDIETKEDTFLMCPPQPAPRRRQKPSRAGKKMKSDSETELGSSSGESNYQSIDYETGSGSRPSSSDIEAMQSGMPSGTASEYETALMSAENSSASRLTSQDYHTAISSLSSRESIKSIYSESSGHLASIESSSEMSETLVPSEGDAERDNLDESIDHVLEEEDFVTVDGPSITKTSYSSDSDNVPLSQTGEGEGEDEGVVAPSRMKRSSEMIFQQEDEEVEGGEKEEKKHAENEDEHGGKDTLRVKVVDNATSTLPIDGKELSLRDKICSVDLTTSRVDEDGIQSVCTQVTSSYPEMEKREIEEIEKKVENLKEMEEKMEKLKEMEEKVEKLKEMEKKVEKLEEMEKKVEKLEEIEKKVEKLEEMEKKVEKLEEMEKKVEKLEEMEEKVERLKETAESYEVKILAVDDKLPESSSPSSMPEAGIEVEDFAERPELTSIQRTSMSTSSTSGISLETVIDSKERQERRSPDSDSFELVDKPDIIDDFVVIEEVAREAEEFDSEGKSIHIGGMSGAICISGKKNYDTEVENLISSSKDADRARSASLQASKNNELFDFESEESPPQVSNEDQLYSQSYSDDEQYEGGKKWVEMQFQTDARGYEIDYDRGPLEDIKEEEITDFEAGSSRFGSLGSHKESVGSVGSMRGSLGSTPEYDVLAGRKYFTKPSEHDNLSLSSLQEFESLESAVAMENARRALCGSQDSINNGSLPKRYVTSRSGHGDDVSLSSLKDFEGLETACREAHMIELRAREEEDLLDHESPENRYKLECLARSKAESSAPASFNPSTSGSDDYEKRIREIDEIIRIAQSNVEKFDRQDDTADDISQIEITEADSRGAGQSLERTMEIRAGNQSSPLVTQARGKEPNIMETSTDSLELDEQEIDKKCDPLCRSSDSLEMKTALDLPSLSSDSLNNVRDAKEQRHDHASNDQFDDGSRRISSDSLELPLAEQREDGKSSDDYTEKSVEHFSSKDPASHADIGSKNSSSNNGT